LLFCFQHFNVEKRFAPALEIPPAHQEEALKKGVLLPSVVGAILLHATQQQEGDQGQRLGHPPPLS
jgi:hypothetical protein